MPSIEFYYMPESPPCRAVEMVAGLVGVTLNKHLINLFTKDHLQEDFIKLNPLHKVPFIVDGDLKIAESRAIMCYLVAKYSPADDSLYPKDPVVRAQVDEMLYFDIGSLYSSASKLLRPKLFGPCKELDKEAEKAFRDNLEFLDNKLKLGGDKFVVGDQLTLADITFAASFSFPLACDYDISAFKSITSYLDRLKTAIAGFAEINDKPTENMRNYIRSKQ